MLLRASITKHIAMGPQVAFMSQEWILADRRNTGSQSYSHEEMNSANSP